MILRRLPLTSFVRIYRHARRTERVDKHRKGCISSSLKEMQGPRNSRPPPSPHQQMSTSILLAPHLRRLLNQTRSTSSENMISAKPGISEGVVGNFRAKRLG